MLRLFVNYSILLVLFYEFVHIEYKGETRLCCVTAPTSKKAPFFSRNVEKSPMIDHGMCGMLADLFINMVQRIKYSLL